MLKIKIDSASSTTTPLWLIVSALAFLSLRGYLVHAEIKNPPKSNLQVNWHKPAEEKQAGDKPILYFFTSPGLGSCEEIEANCFHNRALVEKINNNFFPIRVEHSSLPSQPVPAEILDLEERYTILTVPEIITAMLPSYKIASSLTKVRLREVDGFLDESLKEVPYARAYPAFSSEKFAEAADFYDQFLKSVDFKGNLAATACVRRYCCLQLIGKSDEAKNFLKTAEGKIEKNYWPYQLIEYLTGKITEKELEDEAGHDKLQRIDYHFYKALEPFSQKQYAKAKPDLDWIVKLKAYQEHSEVMLAKRWLAQIAKAEKAAKETQTSTEKDNRTNQKSSTSPKQH